MVSPHGAVRLSSITALPRGTTRPILSRSQELVKAVRVATSEAVGLPMVRFNRQGAMQSAAGEFAEEQ